MAPLKILIIGANGQIGTELAEALARRHGPAAVVTSDLAPQGRLPHLRHEALDVTDAAALAAAVKRHGITQIYLLAAALSASGEQHPQWAWHLNMTGLLNVLELARTAKLQRVFWPSSIAAFGPGRGLLVGLLAAGHLCFFTAGRQAERQTQEQDCQERSHDLVAVGFGSPVVPAEGLP